MNVRELAEQLQRLVEAGRGDDVVLAHLLPDDFHSIVHSGDPEAMLSRVDWEVSDILVPDRPDTFVALNARPEQRR